MDIVERLRLRAKEKDYGVIPFNLLLDAAEEIERLRAENAELRARSAAWAVSFAEKCNDCEDLKLQNRELADARIADAFARHDAEEAARAEAFERAAQIAESLPVLRPISTAHVKATTPADVAAAIRQEATRTASGESGERHTEPVEIGESGDR